MKQLSEKEISEIKSLVKLLDDDDLQVFDTVREKLLSYGGQALSYIVPPTAATSGIAKRFNEIRDLITRSVFKQEIRNLKRTQDGDYDLEEGVFLIARHRYPSIDVQQYTELLNSYAYELKEKLSSISDQSEILHRIIDFFVKDKKFTGNLQDYYNEDNYYINKVLETRTGIPITLSVVYLLVGRRINLPITGIGLPGHFSLQFSYGATKIFFDPYNNGAILSRADCEEMVKGLGFTFTEDYLKPVSNKQILERMLRNIILSLEKKGGKDKIETIRQFIDTLNSDL
ncbi:MAG: transglutaminase-like domain-containing protein [Bacteroidota bacterium]|nr:transglutaminase-like domain-containing protein [Bacteroidota bacterium]